MMEVEVTEDETRGMEGLSLATRLELYMDLFLQRSDVVTLSRAITRGSGVVEEVPPDVAELSREVTSLDYTWSFAPSAGIDPDSLQKMAHTRPYHGGLSLGPLDGLRWIESELSLWKVIDHDAQESARLGGISHADAFHLIVPWPHGTRSEAYIGATSFVDGGNFGGVPASQTHTRFPDLTSYLTLGARKGFTSHWDFWWDAEEEDPEESELALRARSLPADTPKAQVLARLEDRGASRPEAEALWAWIQQDTVLLLEIL